MMKVEKKRKIFQLVLFGILFVRHISSSAMRCTLPFTVTTFIYHKTDKSVAEGKVSDLYTDLNNLKKFMNFTLKRLPMSYGSLMHEMLDLRFCTHSLHHPRAANL